MVFGSDLQEGSLADGLHGLAMVTLSPKPQTLKRLVAQTNPKPPICQSLRLPYGGKGPFSPLSYLLGELNPPIPLSQLWRYPSNIQPSKGTIQRPSIPDSLLGSKEESVFARCQRRRLCRVRALSG